MAPSGSGATAAPSHLAVVLRRPRPGSCRRPPGADPPDHHPAEAAGSAVKPGRGRKCGEVGLFQSAVKVGAVAKCGESGGGVRNIAVAGSGRGREDGAVLTWTALTAETTPQWARSEEHTSELQS